jgi:type II secretory pathway component PulF
VFISWSGSVGAITALVSSLFGRKHVSEAPAQGLTLGREALVHWLESLSTMLEAGVTLPAALLHIAGNSPQAVCRALTADLIESITSGSTLSKAASRHVGTFSPLHLSLLRLGEERGSLLGVVRSLATLERRLLTAGERIRGSLTYPLMLFVGCTAGLALAPPLLLEPHFQLIRDLQVEIPVLTRCLMDFSEWMRTPWSSLVVAAGLVCLARLFRLLACSRRALLLATSSLLRTPKLAALIRSLLAIRFGRALLVQLQCGVAPGEAVDVVARSAANPVLRNEAENVLDKMLRGEDLLGALRSGPLFSPLFARSALLRSARTPQEIAETLAETGTRDLDSSLDDVTGLIEPTIVAVIGLIVFTMVLATMLPLSKALDAL